VATIGEKQRTLAVATASALMNAGHHKGRPAGPGGQFAGAQKGKANHAGSDRDSIATIADVSDGNAGAIGTGRAGALDLSAGNVSGSSLVGVSSISAGTAIRLQGPVGGPVGGALGSALAPIVPKLTLLPQVQ
jgi:hypothetical protein